MGRPQAKTVYVVTKPPSRWRNWWVAKRAGIMVCSVCGARTPVGPGDVYGTHCRRYPSRDVAETRAMIFMQQDGGKFADWIEARSD